MIGALILAAGKSERMGYPKALLKIGPENFVQCLLRVAAEAGIENRGVVIGHQARELKRLLDIGSVPVFVNHRYQTGQISSLQLGMRSLTLDDLDALVVLPVDHPLISTRLITDLVARFQAGNPAAVVPTFREKRGHPTLFSRRLYQDLLECPPGEGARTVLRKHSSEIAYLEWDDMSVLFNVDSFDEYKQLLLRGPDLVHSSPSGCSHPAGQHEPLTTAAIYCPRCRGKLEMCPTEPEGKPQRVCVECGFIFYLNPKVVACALPVRDGKLLLVRRNIEPARGRWTYPGGYMDLGESVDEAARRETLEEAGIEVTLGRLIGVYSYHDIPHVVIVYEAPRQEGKLQPGIEVQEARYFSPREIPWEELAFQSTREAIRDWISLWE